MYTFELTLKLVMDGQSERPTYQQTDIGHALSLTATTCFKLGRFTMVSKPIDLG